MEKTRNDKVRMEDKVGRETRLHTMLAVVYKIAEVALHSLRQ
jgi:hypothetical protein